MRSASLSVDCHRIRSTIERSGEERCHAATEGVGKPSVFIAACLVEFWFSIEHRTQHLFYFTIFFFKIRDGSKVSTSCDFAWLHQTFEVSAVLGRQT